MYYAADIIISMSGCKECSIATFDMLTAKLEVKLKDDT